MVKRGCLRNDLRIVRKYKRRIGVTEIGRCYLGNADFAACDRAIGDTVIHYDPWWNPAAQAQATDRAYRIGQTRPVFVYNLIVGGSVEERMVGLQRRKQNLADSILSAGDPNLKLTEDDVDDLFAPLSTERDAS